MINSTKPVEKQLSTKYSYDTIERIENHRNAAEHHEAAAKYHLEAAMHLEAGNHRNARKSSDKAREHLYLVNETLREDIKYPPFIT